MNKKITTISLKKVSKIIELLPLVYGSVCPFVVIFKGIIKKARKPSYICVQ